jgi:hypothetical protein
MLKNKMESVFETVPINRSGTSPQDDRIEDFPWQRD